MNQGMIVIMPDGGPAVIVAVLGTACVVQCCGEQIGISLSELTRAVPDA